MDGSHWALARQTVLKSPMQTFGHSPGKPTALAVAKESMRIPDLAAKRGWEWQPSRSCPVPYRQDRNCSGSVFNEGRLFHDFATSETMDAPGLLQRMEGLDRRTACKLFIELAGIAATSSEIRKCVFVSPAATKARKEIHEKPVLPVLDRLRSEERLALAHLRGLSIAAVELADENGLLCGLNWCGHRAWAVTDCERWNCQWRRLDGGKWRGRDGAEFKSWSASQRGVNRPRAGWPVGIVEASKADSIVLVEGGPDLLAAFHFIHLEGMDGILAPVAMLGAIRIDPLALPYFGRKRVRIMCHADEATLENGTKRPGLEAAARWQDQLLSVGCTVDAFDFTGLTQSNGDRVKDLCDLANLSADDFESERDEISQLMIIQ